MPLRLAIASMASVGRTDDAHVMQGSPRHRMGLRAPHARLVSLRPAPGIAKVATMFIFLSDRILFLFIFQFASWVVRDALTKLVLVSNARQGSPRIRTIAPNVFLPNPPRPPERYALMEALATEHLAPLVRPHVGPVQELRPMTASFVLLVSTC